MTRGQEAARRFVVVRGLAAGRDGASGQPQTKADWVLKPGDKWHGFEGLAENHVLVDPIKVTILTPGPVGRTAACTSTAFPPPSIVKFLSSRRIEIEKTGLYSFLVLFSMGITKGKWSTLVTELLNFKDLYDANAPLKRVLPALADAHPEAYGQWASRTCATRIHKVYRDDNVPKAQRGHVHRRCPRWRCGRPMPTSSSCAARSRASRSTT